MLVSNSSTGFVLVSLFGLLWFEHSEGRDASLKNKLTCKNSFVWLYYCCYPHSSFQLDVGLDQRNLCPYWLLQLCGVSLGVCLDIEQSEGKTTITTVLVKGSSILSLTFYDVRSRSEKASGSGFCLTVILINYINQKGISTHAVQWY